MKDHYARLFVIQLAKELRGERNQLLQHILTKVYSQVLKTCTASFDESFNCEMARQYCLHKILGHFGITHSNRHLISRKHLNTQMKPDADVKVWLLSMFYDVIKLEENLKDKNRNFTSQHTHTHIKDAVGSAWNHQVRHTVSTQCWISWNF